MAKSRRDAEMESLPPIEGGKRVRKTGDTNPSGRVHDEEEHEGNLKFEVSLCIPLCRLVAYVRENMTLACVLSRSHLSRVLLRALQTVLLLSRSRFQYLPFLLSLSCSHALSRSRSCSLVRVCFLSLPSPLCCMGVQKSMTMHAHPLGRTK